MLKSVRETKRDIFFVYYIRLKIRLKLFAGIFTISLKTNPTFSPNCSTSSKFLNPQSLFFLFSCSHNIIIRTLTILSGLFGSQLHVLKKMTPVVKELTPVVKELTPVVKNLSPVVKKLTPVVKELTWLQKRVYAHRFVISQKGSSCLAVEADCDW